MGFFVLMSPGRLSEEHQQVDQEDAGDQHQVNEQRIRLKIFWSKLNRRTNKPSPPYLHIMVILRSEVCESVDHNDNIDGHYEDTVSTGKYFSCCSQ